MNISDSTEVCYYSTVGALATWGKTHHHKTVLGTNTLQGRWYFFIYFFPRANAVQIAYPCWIAQWHLMLLLLFYQQTNSISRWCPLLKSMSWLINRQKKGSQKAEARKTNPWKANPCAAFCLSPCQSYCQEVDLKKNWFSCRSCPGGGSHSCRSYQLPIQSVGLLAHIHLWLCQGFPARYCPEIRHTVNEDRVEWCGIPNAQLARSESVA